MRWLTAPERRSWLGLLGVLAGLDTALDQQLQRDAGVSHATYGILAALSAHPDGRHMSELAGLARFSQSRLSHAVRRLEEQGLVGRRECSHDKRSTHAVLTARGREVVERAAPGHVTAVRRLVFDRLTPAQVEQLGAIVDTLRVGLEEEGLTGLPGFPGRHADRPSPAPEAQPSR